jgi:hypothetical protein
MEAITNQVMPISNQVEASPNQVVAISNQVVAISELNEGVIKLFFAFSQLLLG